MKKELFFLSFVTILLLGMTVSVNGITNEESKQKIITAVNRTVEGNWSSIDMFSISRYKDSNTEVVVNNSEPNIPPPPPACPPNTHLENGLCVPNTPPPQPNVTKVEVILVGDIDDKRVLPALVNEKSDYAFYLGDLEYGSVSEYTPYKTVAKVVKCMLGNHDDDFVPVCGDDAWNIKTGKVLWVAFNSEGNYAAQKTQVKSFFQNETLMKDVKAVHLLSHKPTESVPPNSHHGLESGVVDFGNYVETLVPQGVLLFRENGHNHLYSESKDGLLKQIGSGGRDLYECGTNSVWVYCNNDDYGYFKYEVNLVTGETTGHFYGTDGKVIR